MKNKILLLIFLFTSFISFSQDYYELSSKLGGRFIYGQNVILKANKEVLLVFPVQLNGYYVIAVEAQKDIYIEADTISTVANKFEVRVFKQSKSEIDLWLINQEDKNKVSIVIHYYGLTKEND